MDEEAEQSMKYGETQIASYWSADTVKEIAKLPSPEPVVVKSRGVKTKNSIHPVKLPSDSTGKSIFRLQNLTHPTPSPPSEP